MKRTNSEYQGLTQAVINLATALRDGTHTGPAHGVAALLRENAETLVAWTDDDRGGKSDQRPE